MALGRPPVVLDPALVGPDERRAALGRVHAAAHLPARRGPRRHGGGAGRGRARAARLGRRADLHAAGAATACTSRTAARCGRATWSIRSCVRARSGRWAGACSRVSRRRRATTTTRTVRLVLRRPDPSFPHALAAVQAGVVPASTPMRAARARPPAGIGPYASSRRGPGARFVLTRNRDFSLPGVPGGRLDQRGRDSGGTPAEQTEAVAADRLDVMITPPPADRLPELRSELRERYSEHPDLDTMYLAVRSRGAAFGKPKLREALARALDKPEAARRLGGLVRTTCNVLPPLTARLHGDRPVSVGGPVRAPRSRAGTRARGGGGRGRPAGGRVGLARRRRRWRGYYVATLRKIGLLATRGAAPRRRRAPAHRSRAGAGPGALPGPAGRPGAAGGGRARRGSPPTSWPARTIPTSARGWPSSSTPSWWRAP